MISFGSSTDLEPLTAKKSEQGKRETKQGTRSRVVEDLDDGRAAHDQ